MNENEEEEVNRVEQVSDEHSVDFDVDLLSEVGKELVFILAPFSMSHVVYSALFCFRPHKEDVCISKEIEENHQHGDEEEKDCLRIAS